MKIRKYILLSLFLLPGLSPAQNVFTNLKSLEKRADNMYKELAYQSAIDLYTQALAKEKSKDKTSIKTKIAKSYYFLRLNIEAEFWYREVMASKKALPKADSTIFYNILLYNEKYEEAEKWIKKPSAKVKTDNTAAVPFLTNIHELYRDSLCYAVEKSSFNSNHSDYSPIYFLEGIIFISDREVFSPIRVINLQKDAGMSEAYYVAFKSINSKPKKISLGLKDNINIGPATVYENNRKIIFTSNNLEGLSSSRKNLQLYSAEYNPSKKEWFNISPLNINTKNNSFGHPSVSKDGKMLYYVSDMPGGYGGTDLYVSFLQNNFWSKPQNLGPAINTSGNEMFPYISKSGKLYFSSDNPKGLGGLDIYYIDSGSVSKTPINMGYPINSAHDDFGIIIHEEDSTGYFSSNRNNSLGGDNIYKFKSKRIKVELTILDDLTKKALTDFKTVVSDPEFKTTCEPDISNLQKGKYVYYLKPGHIYLISIKKEDYQEYKEEFSTVTTKESFVAINISLRRKYSYYGSIRVRDSITENMIPHAKIVYMNLNDEKIDSVKTDDKGVVNIKLDRDADYYIVANNKITSGSVFIEKQPKRKASSVSYYSILTKAENQKNSSVQVSDSSGVGIADLDVEINNPLTCENKLLKTDKDGRVYFSLLNTRYYSITCAGNVYQVEDNRYKKISSGREIKLELK